MAITSLLTFTLFLYFFLCCINAAPNDKLKNKEKRSRNHHQQQQVPIDPKKAARDKEDAEIALFNEKKLLLERDEKLLKKIMTMNIPFPTIKKNERILFIGYESTTHQPQANLQNYIKLFTEELNYRHLNVTTKIMTIQELNHQHFLQIMKNHENSLIHELSPTLMIFTIGHEIVTYSNKDMMELREEIGQIIAFFLRQQISIVTVSCFIYGENDYLSNPYDTIFDEWDSQLRQLSREYEMPYIDLHTSLYSLRQQLYNNNHNNNHNNHHHNYHHHLLTLNGHIFNEFGNIALAKQLLRIFYIQDQLIHSSFHWWSQEVKRLAHQEKQQLQEQQVISQEMNRFPSLSSDSLVWSEEINSSIE
jgi:hypothetical protein